MVWKRGHVFTSDVISLSSDYEWQVANNTMYY